MKYFTSKLLWTQIVALLLLWILLYPQTVWYWQLIRGVFASIFMLYIPGNRLSYIFFRKRKEVSGFERFIMSFALSLAVIVLAAFYLHYFGIVLYPIHIYVISVSVIGISYLVLWLTTGRTIKKQAKIVS